MSEPRDRQDYLSDMLEAADKVSSFVQGMTREMFLDDDRTQYAVVRGLEVIGEAAKKVPDAIRQFYPLIPWRQVAGMRDKLVHDYFGVNAQVVWKTAIEDVPAIAATLRDTET